MHKTEEIIIAGFGGQGVLSMGMMLSYSAMIEEKETSWMPSYGPEMRGGTANCTVIVSDKQISSPLVSKYDAAIILNQPSMDKFESKVKPGGILVYEQSTVITPPTRDDIQILGISAIEEAQKLEAKQVANMIILGAYLQKSPIVSIDNVVKALKSVLPERRHNLIPVNEKALARGQEIAAAIKEEETV